MTGETHTRTVTIVSPHGLHLRPIQAFVALANQYQCEVFVSKGSLRINGKSPILLLGLEATPASSRKTREKKLEIRRSRSETRMSKVATGNCTSKWIIGPCRLNWR